MKRHSRLRFGLLVALIAAGTIFMASPYLRTKGYFAFYRAWHSYWPIAAGKQFPDRLSRVFGPFVPIWVQVEPGVNMLLDPYDLVTQCILLRCTWEPSTLHEMEQHLPAGGTFIDVGAHVGWYSLNAAKKVGPTGHVIAVEPNRQTLVVLRDNIRASGASAVVAIAPVACGDSETTLTFYEAPRSNTGASSLSLANLSEVGAPAASYTVRVRRLDDIAREARVERVDALKIDVEGAEFLVLKGAVGILDRYRPVVAVELRDEQLKLMGSSMDEAMAFMRSHGYAPKGRYEMNTVFVPVAAP
jgi:FkbM family methyltransferase